MIPLTAIVITLNEERNIARCIGSLKKAADEILVVDSFSTDRTVEICLEMGVRVIQNKWPGYSTQKNFAQEQARHDFLISLDADEALTDRLVQSIREIKNRPATGLYSFNRLTNYCGQWIRHGGWHPDVKIRIYDRRECEWEGSIHERLVYPKGKTAELLKGDCEHYTFYTIEEHRRQADKFTTLMAEEAAAKGQKSSLLQILFSPVVKFLRDYVFRLGFLDGYYGFVISRISAHATFLKYRKLKKLASEK